MQKLPFTANNGSAFENSTCKTHVVNTHLLTTSLVLDNWILILKQQYIYFFKRNLNKQTQKAEEIMR